MKASGAQNRQRREGAQAAQVAESQFEVRRLANLEPEQRAQLRSTLDAIMLGTLRNPDAAQEPPPVQELEDDQAEGGGGEGEEAPAKEGE